MQATSRASRFFRKFFSFTVDKCARGDYNEVREKISLRDAPIAAKREWKKLSKYGKAGFRLLKLFGGCKSQYVSKKNFYHSQGARGKNVKGAQRSADAKEMMAVSLILRRHGCGHKPISSTTSSTRQTAFLLPCGFSGIAIQTRPVLRTGIWIFDIPSFTAVGTRMRRRSFYVLSPLRIPFSPKRKTRKNPALLARILYR